MINSNVYDYVNLMDKAADAAWIRNEVISNNISNATTPGYKRQDVSFEAELEKALSGTRYISMDDKVANLSLDRLNPRTYTDYASFSYRMDGNNVDIETENVVLAKNQIKYEGLMRSITQEFQNLKSVMK
ncbi:MAG: flagellar basal body rod protein FlgB [Lachnospiraceae bacterium]|nr:flagellar basal body rod protein FlgB [Lachnospiraceae bacterium]